MAHTHQIVSPRRRSRLTSSKLAPKAAARAGVQAPKIFVGVHPVQSYMGMRYAAARIVVKRGCYRYLVWKDGGKKREFYLGKLKILTPPQQLGPDRPRPSPATSPRSRRGVRK